MRKFKDNSGREWSLEITVGSIKRVRNETEAKVNLYKLVDKNFEGLKTLLDDMEQLVDVVFVLVKAEDAAAFAESLSADSVKAMVDAFFEEYLDFFLDRRTADVLRMAKTRNAELIGTVCEKAKAEIAAADVNSMAKTLSGMSTEPSESPATTPT